MDFDQNNDPKEGAEGRKLTLIDDITMNDGALYLEITAAELVKKGLNPYIHYRIRGKDSLG